MKVTKAQRIIAYLLAFVMMFTSLPTFTNTAKANGEAPGEMTEDIIITDGVSTEIEEETPGYFDQIEDEIPSQFIYQVIDKNNQPVEGAIVTIEGEIEENNWDRVTRLYEGNLYNLVYQLVPYFDFLVVLLPYISKVEMPTLSKLSEKNKNYDDATEVEQAEIDILNGIRKNVFNISDAEMKKYVEASNEYSKETDSNGVVKFEWNENALKSIRSIAVKYDKTDYENESECDIDENLFVYYGTQGNTDILTLNADETIVDINGNPRLIIAGRIYTPIRGTIKINTQVPEAAKEATEVKFIFKNTNNEFIEGVKANLTLCDKDGASSDPVELISGEDGVISYQIPSESQYRYVKNLTIVDAPLYAFDDQGFNYNFNSPGYNTHIEENVFSDTIELKKICVLKFEFLGASENMHVIDGEKLDEYYLKQLISRAEYEQLDEFEKVTKFIGWRDSANNFITHDELAKKIFNGNEEYAPEYLDCYRATFYLNQAGINKSLEYTLPAGEKFTDEQLKGIKELEDSVNLANQFYGVGWTVDGTEVDLDEFVMPKKQAKFKIKRIHNSETYTVKYEGCDNIYFRIDNENPNKHLVINDNDTTKAEYRTLKGLLADGLKVMELDTNSHTLYEIDQYVMKIKDDLVLDGSKFIDAGTQISIINEDGKTELLEEYRDKRINADKEIVIEFSKPTEMTVRPVFEWYEKYYDMSDYEIGQVTVTDRITEITNKIAAEIKKTITNGYHYVGATLGIINSDQEIETTNTSNDELLLKYWAKEVRINYSYLGEDNEIHPMEGKEAIIRKAPFKDDELTEMTDVKYSNVSDEIKAILRDTEIASMEIEGTDEAWVLDEENTKVTAMKREGGANHVNVITFNIVFKKALANPITLEHVLWFNGYKVGVIDIKEISKIEKDKDGNIIDYSNAEEVFKAYEGNRLPESKGVLDTYHSKENALVYSIDEETGKEKITFKYWARKIDVKYAWSDEQEVPSDVELPKFKKIDTNYMNYLEFKIFNDDPKTYEEWLTKKGYNANIVATKAGKTEVKESDDKIVYSLTDMKISLGELKVSIGEKQPHAATLTLVYSYDKESNCTHRDTYKYEQITKEDGTVDGTLHHVKCEECKINFDEKHTFDEAGNKCVYCEYVKPSEKGTITRTLQMEAGLMTAIFTEGINLSKSDAEPKTIFEKYILNTAASQIASYIDELEEEAREELEAVGTQISDESNRVIASEIIDAIRNGRIAFDEVNGEIIVSHISHRSNSNVGYDITITFETSSINIGAMQLRGERNPNAVIAYIKEQILASLANATGAKRGVTANADDIEVDCFTELQIAQGIEYGTYSVNAIVTTDTNEKLAYTGTIRLYSTGGGSSNRRNPSTDTRIDDEDLAQAGGALEDLRNVRPDEMITRSEFVGVLAEVFNVLDNNNYKPFQDINGDTNEDKIKKYSAFEIVKGYCDEEFGPNDYITKEQMVLILSRALKFVGKTESMSEEEIAEQLAKAIDASNVSDWAREGVAIAIKMGLIDTETSNEAKPLDKVARSAAADQLQAFLKLLADDDSSDDEKTE